MSWDLLILNLGQRSSSFDELPRDYVPPPLGAPDEVRRKLDASVQGILWVEPRRGKLEADGFVMYFSVEAGEPRGVPGVVAGQVYAIGIAVSFEIDNAIGRLRKLCRDTGWTVINCTGGYKALDLDEV